MNALKRAKSWWIDPARHESWQEGKNQSDRWRGWQNERNAKRARPVVTWKGPQWLSTGRTHLIRHLISHPVTNQHAGATTRDVRFKHFQPRANNKAVNVIDTDKGEPEQRFGLTSFALSSPLPSFFPVCFLLSQPRRGSARQLDSRTKINSSKMVCGGGFELQLGN